MAEALVSARELLCLKFQAIPQDKQRLEGRTLCYRASFPFFGSAWVCCQHVGNCYSANNGCFRDNGSNHALSIQCRCLTTATECEVKSRVMY